MFSLPLTSRTISWFGSRYWSLQCLRITAWYVLELGDEVDGNEDEDDDKVCLLANRAK